MEFFKPGLYNRNEQSAPDTMDASPFNKLPAELRVQIYGLVLLEAHDVHLVLTVQHYPQSELLYCYEGRHEAIHQSFDLVLPTRSMKEARMEVRKSVFRQRDRLMDHQGHCSCELGADAEIHAGEVGSLLCNYYTIMRAPGMGASDFIDGIGSFRAGCVTLSEDAKDRLLQIMGEDN